MVNKKMAKKGKCDEGLCKYAKTGCMAGTYMETKTSEQLIKEYGSDDFEVIKYKLPCDPGKEHVKCKFYRLNEVMRPMITCYNDIITNGTEEDKELVKKVAGCLESELKNGGLNINEALGVSNHFPELIERVKKSQKKGSDR